MNRTPLHYAAMNEEYGPEVMQILFDAGANLNTTMSLGFTILHQAAYFGLLDNVKFIVENWVNRGLTSFTINAKDWYSGTAMTRASTTSVKDYLKSQGGIRSLSVGADGLEGAFDFDANRKPKWTR